MIKFLFLGVLQGLTEFLPISSSGHLYIFKKVTGMEFDMLPFFVLLHLATLLSIIVFMRKYLLKMLSDKKIWLMLSLVTFVTGILGIIAEHFLKGFFENKYIVSLCFLTNSFILLRLSTHEEPSTKSIPNFKESGLLGCIQAIAVFPGISRSGITINSMIKLGFNNQKAFNLSFLMAIPVILGSVILESRKIVVIDIPAINLWIGFISAFFSGLLGLWIAKKLLATLKFKNFGYYCIFMFLIVLLIK